MDTEAPRFAQITKVGLEAWTFAVFQVKTTWTVIIKTFTCLQSSWQSQSSDLSPYHLKAHQESPSESRSPHHLFKHVMYAFHSLPDSAVHIWHGNYKVNCDFQSAYTLFYALLCTFNQLHQRDIRGFPLPSERVCKAKVRWTTITCRRTGKSEHLSSPRNPAFWHLKNRTWVVMTMIRKRKLYSDIILCHIYLLSRNLVCAGDQQFSQVFDPVFLFSLELILFLEQLGENLLLCGCGLCDWRNLLGGHPQVSG